MCIRDSARLALDAELGRFEPGVPLAIRSSATAEDSAAASFAGAYETLLGVSADRVVDAIGRVRASAVSDRVEAYTRAIGVHAGEVAAVSYTHLDVYKRQDHHGGKRADQLVADRHGLAWKELAHGA